MPRAKPSHRPAVVATLTRNQLSISHEFRTNAVSKAATNDQRQRESSRSNTAFDRLRTRLALASTAKTGAVEAMPQTAEDRDTCCSINQGARKEVPARKDHHRSSRASPLSVTLGGPRSRFDLGSAAVESTIRKQTSTTDVCANAQRSVMFGRAAEVGDSAMMSQPEQTQSSQSSQTLDQGSQDSAMRDITAVAVVSSNLQAESRASPLSMKLGGLRSRLVLRSTAAATATVPVETLPSLLGNKKLGTQSSVPSIESASEADEDGSPGMTIIPSEADIHLQGKCIGRAVRKAARAAQEAIANSDWSQWGSAKKKQRSRRHEDSKSAPVNPSYVEALLNRVVDRMVDKDGTIKYRVDWADEDDPDERYSWEPAEHLRGHEDWMKLVDLWKTKYENKYSFSAVIKNNAAGYEVGDGDETKCFFYAVEAVRKLLKLEGFNLDAVVAKLANKGWNFSGGVKKKALQPLMEALASSGLKLDFKVWSRNLHKTEMGTGPQGVALSLPPGPGIYMVGTLDPRHRGHCWVLHVNQDRMMRVYDNGCETDFSQVRFKTLLWVRQCVPFLMVRRKRGRSKRPNPRG